MNSPVWKYLHTKIEVILWLNFSLYFHLFKVVVKQQCLFHQIGKAESESNNKLDQQI